MKTKKIFFGVLFVFLAFVLSTDLLAEDFYVSPTGGGDCSMGDPCDLQSALSFAQSNGEDDTIYLSAGTYDASGGPFIYQAAATENYDLTIKGEGKDLTILDGSLSSQIMHIDTISVPDASDIHIIIKGVAFKRGKTEVSGSFVESDQGGGLNALINQATIEVVDSLFENNSVINLDTGPTCGDGGGAFLWGRTIILRNNVFTDNFATWGGGGVHAHSVEMTIEKNIFNNNSSDNYEGGAYLYPDRLTMTNNIFSHNSAVQAAGGVFIDAFHSEIILNIVNNTISDNTADPTTGFGGGMWIHLEPDCIANIYNNILWNNTASGGEDVGTDLHVTRHTGNETVNLYNNDYGDIYIEDYDTAVKQGGNIPYDPLFVNPATEDYHIQEFSPCRDAGDPSAPNLPVDDFEGDPRDADTAPPDIGADEFYPVDEEINDIIDFFDTSVEDGSLEGTDSGSSSRGRLMGLRNMLNTARNLINRGNINGACQQLQNAYLRTDGKFPPPDFVKGDAAENLAKMILDLMENLGCE